MKWRRFQYKDDNYDLTHLHPFEWSFTAPETNSRPERIYRFHVNFSAHCFTRKPNTNEDFDQNLIYHSPKEGRIFCCDRYQLSFNLPDMVRGLGTGFCWHTNHGSFFTMKIVDLNGNKIDYEAYFDVTRSRRPGWLYLTILSAYPRDPNHQSSRPRKRKIRLAVIAYNRLHGKAINAQP